MHPNMIKGIFSVQKCAIGFSKNEWLYFYYSIHSFCDLPIRKNHHPPVLKYCIISLY